MDVFLRGVHGRLLEAVNVEVVESDYSYRPTADASDFDETHIAVDPCVWEFDDE